MAKKIRTPQMPKQRNYAAALVRDPNGPFRPKTIPNKRDAVIPRKRKHKGRDNDS
jgi:hypothetical protein